MPRIGRRTESPRRQRRRRIAGTARRSRQLRALAAASPAAFALAVAAAAPAQAADLLVLEGDEVLLGGAAAYGIVYVDGTVRLTGDTAIYAQSIYVGPNARVLTCHVPGVGDDACGAGRNLTLKSPGPVTVAQSLDLTGGSGGRARRARADSCWSAGATWRSEARSRRPATTGRRGGCRWPARAPSRPATSGPRAPRSSPQRRRGGRVRRHRRRRVGLGAAPGGGRAPRRRNRRDRLDGGRRRGPRLGLRRRPRLRHRPGVASGYAGGSVAVVGGDVRVGAADASGGNATTGPQACRARSAWLRGARSTCSGGSTRPAAAPRPDPPPAAATWKSAPPGLPWWRGARRRQGAGARRAERPEARSTSPEER